MTDEIFELPDRLEYLRPILRKYTDPRPDNGGTEDAWARADNLDTPDLQELAAAYREIARRDDVHALSAWAKADEDRFWKQWKPWCQLNEEREARGQPPMPDEQSPVHERGLQLFYVFDRLAKRKLPPFNTREVVYSPPPVVLDWSKLPPDLHYVREPAMKYGKLWTTNNHPDRLARRMTSEQRKELQALAARLRPTGDINRLWEWERQYRMADHPEAHLVMGLLQVLADVVPW